MSVVTLGEAKEHLNISVSTYDGELAEFIDRAQSACEAYLGGPLESVSVTESADGGRESLALRKYPLISVTTVLESATTLSATDYVIDYDNGILFRGSTTSPTTWASGRRNVSVTYVAGRDDDLPSDLVQAVLEMLRHLWTTQRGAMDGRNPFSGDEYASGLGWSYPRRVMELLDAYRLPGIA